MQTKIGIVKKGQYHTTKWSGGTTTELLIYPSDSNYSERSFKWRISSAKIEDSQSIFTHLPGITRHIMITSGQITLSHKCKYEKVLAPFEQDSFMGEWETKSFGMGTDFNLMLTGGFNGKLKAYFLKEDEQIDIILNEVNGKQITNIFYALNGSLKFEIKDQEFNAQEKDLFYIMGSPTERLLVIKLTNKSHNKLRVISALIWE
jgi:uncharacterized protein